MFIVVICSQDTPIIVNISEYQLDYEVVLLPYKDEILALSVRSGKIFNNRYAVIRVG